MKGRMEHQLVNNRKCEEILNTLPDFVSDYYYAMQASNKESTTCLAYLRKLKVFINSLDNINNISDITERMCSKFLISIGTKVVDGDMVETSFSNKKQYHAILNSFFNYYVKSGKIKISPMAAIERPKNSDNVKHIKMDTIDLKHILNSVESENVNNIKDWIKERDKTILRLFMDTGMRKTAMIEINIDDINFEERELTVIDKRHKKHIYYLTDNMCKQIKTYLDKRNQRNNIDNNDALFISQWGNRMSATAIDTVVNKYTEKGTGVKLSPHKLRGAYCTILYDKTKDIEFVRDAVGHSNVTTTQRYISKSNSAKRQAAILMEDNLDNLD